MHWAAFLWLFAAGGQVQPAGTPDAFARLANEATEARAQNHVGEAIDLYRQAVAVRPSWPEGWWFLGELLYDQDKYEESRDALRRLVSLDPKAGPGFALLGLCEYETREYDRALADINEGRRLGLGDDMQVRRVVLYHAAILFTRIGWYESAMQVLEKALDLGATGEAVTQAAGLAGLRWPMLPEDIMQDRKNLIDRAGKAVCAMVQHKDTEAQKYFAELLANYPNEPNVHYLHGTFLLETDADAGLREFQKELELNPRHAAALVHTALEYRQLGESEKALAYAQRAVEAAPEFFAAHFTLGRMLMSAGDAEKGIRELEVARKEAPDSPQVRLALASAYSIAGRTEEAARERAEFSRLKQLADQTMGIDASLQPYP